MTTNFFLSHAQKCKSILIQSAKIMRNAHHTKYRGCGFESGFNDFVDPDPDTGGKKKRKKCTFKKIFILY
jgi:hypothetical protein